MLRESIEIAGGDSINMDGLTDPACTEIPGISHSKVLLDYSNAFMGDDDQALDKARDALVREMGDAELVDAAGVASNFQRMVRIADATGIPSDPPMAIMQEDLAEQLGVNDYVSAANTKKATGLKRLFMKLIVIPQVRKVMKKQSGQN